MLEGSQYHVCARDLGLVLLLVQCPINRLGNFGNRLREMRITLYLDITPASPFLYSDGTKHDGKRSAGDPCLSLCNPGDLPDEVTVGDHAERPGLFVPTRRGEACRFEHILYYIFGDSSVLELASAHAFFQ